MESPGKEEERKAKIHLGARSEGRSQTDDTAGRR